MLTFVCFEPFDFAFEALGQSIWAKNLPPRILKALKKTIQTGKYDKLTTPGCGIAIEIKYSVKNDSKSLIKLQVSRNWKKSAKNVKSA